MPRAVPYPPQSQCGRLYPDPFSRLLMSCLSFSDFFLGRGKTNSSTPFAQGVGTTFSAHTEAEKCPRVLGDPPIPRPSLSKESSLRFLGQKSNIWRRNSSSNNPSSPLQVGKTAHDVGRLACILGLTNSHNQSP